MTAGVRRRRGTGHELRAVVLAATTDLLAELGDVEALTMRAVASAAGVTAPSVYRHFPDKEALVRAVITERFAEFGSVMHAAAGADDPVERLAQVAHAYVRYGLDHPGHYRVLFSATHAGPAGLGLRAAEEHPGAAAFRILVDSVAACIGPDETEVAELSVELWSSLHGVVDLRITKPEIPWPDPERLTERALGPVRAEAGR